MSDGTDKSWLGLEGRHAIVTGAGGGIGRAICLTLAAAGCRVTAIDLRADDADATVADIRAAGGQAEASACDISKVDAVQAAADRAAAAFGPAAILVNNAGLLRPGPLADISLADWNLLLSVNLTGYLVCAQIVGRQMRAAGQGGTLVHTASVAAEHATPFSGAYSVAKAGIVMLSRQLAIEWAPDRIRSNCVNPGMIRTPMSEAFYLQPGATEKRSAVIPTGRIGRPQDIADAVAFLASPRSDYVNGEEIVVDGGYTRNAMALIPRAGYGPGERTPA